MFIGMCRRNIPSVEVLRCFLLETFRFLTGSAGQSLRAPLRVFYSRRRATRPGAPSLMCCPKRDSAAGWHCNPEVTRATRLFSCVPIPSGAAFNAVHHGPRPRTLRCPSRRLPPMSFEVNSGSSIVTPRPHTTPNTEQRLRKGTSFVAILTFFQN
eukprot:3629222-Amphidinium_carterae.2